MVQKNGNTYDKRVCGVYVMVLVLVVSRLSWASRPQMLA
jgi:hypothetical protein